MDLLGTRYQRLATLLFCATSAFAQITGELRGVVTDPSGAAVADARITLRDLETGQQRSATANALGEFGFSLLRIGQYEVRAEAPGFRNVAARAEIRTGEITDVRLPLEVGQVTETVQITDAATLLDTSNAQIQTSFTGQTIQELPVGRNPNLFVLAAPGIAPVSSNNPFLGSGSFNANGGRGRGNNIMVDGITATDVSVTGTGGTLNPLNFSSIKEVKIITNGFSAEYGRNSTSQVLYITKNGTNELHGELFEYFRNNVLNARPFFDTSGRANIQKRNEYGYSLGGPVFIPKIADLRNRVFWFTDFQQLKNRGAGASRIARVPTPDQVVGITDPTSRALITQYQIPTSPTSQITTAAPNKQDFWQYAIRGDWNITDNDTLWVRYSSSENIEEATSLTFVGGNLPGFGATSQGAPRQTTVAHTHLFGARAVNEFRFGYGKHDSGFPIDTPYPLGPRVTFADTSVASFGVWEGLPQGREQQTFQYNNNLSVTVGSHVLKFGGEYYKLVADSFFDSFQRPVLQFANFADFQQGRPASLTQRFGSSVRNNRVTNFFGFVQDDYRVTRNLTLNLGMRVEWAGGPKEANGLISNLDLNNTQAYGAAGTGPFGLLVTGQPSFRSNTNWAPRLGFAWNLGPNGNTVIRGGYGIAYDFIFLNPITNQRFLPPFIVTGTLTGQANFTGENSMANLVAGNALIQRQTAGQAGTLSQTALNFGAISPAIDFGLRNPQAHQWNVGVQREQFGAVWKATYVGTKGNYLLRSRDINPIANRPAPATSLEDETARLTQFQAAFAGQNGGLTTRSNRLDPRYNTIAYTDNSANSNYHSLQLEALRRFSDTFTLNANYTWAKSIDDGSDVLNTLVGDSPTQQDPFNNRNNRAPSQFDLRHRFVITHLWEPAWFRGSSNWFAKNIVGNWGFSGITSFRTGFPVTLEAGSRRAQPILTVMGAGGAVRPNASGPFEFNPKPAGSEGAPFGTTNPDGFQAISTYAQSLGLSQPLLGNFGNLGRNVVRLNGERNFDWNIYKNFSITENAKFQIRSEFYNIFNNTSFQEVSRVITAPDFGQYTSVAQNARIIQLGARLVF
jgi:outer membrane receptor protein involved in Fe transport